MSQRTSLDDLVSLGLAAKGPCPTEGDISNFTLRRRVIQHPRFTLAVREIARIHRRGREAGVAEGMLFVAQTGSGKSTLLNWYSSQFPRCVLAGVTRIPVLHVDTPEAPTVRVLAETFLQALGDPAFNKGSTPDKTNRIIRLCQTCQVELILVEEFQHFFVGNRVAECLRVSNWLKLLITKTRVPFVLSGLPSSAQVVRINPQLRRRFAAPHFMAPFAFGTKTERLEFRGLLKALSAHLPSGSIDLSEPDVAMRMFFATHGLIDYIIKLLDDAGSRGGTGKGGGITVEDLAGSFSNVIWRGAPEALNPFSKKPKLRLLNRLGEPFDILEDPALHLGRAPSKAEAPAASDD